MIFIVRLNNMKSIATLLALFAVSSFVVATEPKDDRPFCKSVEEAANWVLKKCEPEFSLKIARTPKEGLIHLHLGFGMWIRNNVPVWGNTDLIESVGKDVHPDEVGGIILDRYWQLARTKLPPMERERIEYFETHLGKLKGSKPKAKTHENVLKELNAQIAAEWPKNAPHKPFLLKADADTHFNWEPDRMSSELKANVELFTSYHRSMPFYRGDYLCVGNPDK